MSKGFSLVEMLVAAGVTAIFLVVMLPFFMFQTSQQTASSRAKYADQEVDLALTFMRRDIQEAGFGCRGHKELALYIIDGGADGDPDQLYINYGGYLNLMGTVGLQGLESCGSESGRQAYFLLLNSVFNSNSVNLYRCSSWNHLRYQGVIDWDQNCKYCGSGRFALYGIPSDVSKYAIGGVIGKTKGTSSVDTVMDVNLYDTVVPATEPGPLPDSLQNIEYTVAANWGGASLNGRLFTPAISYRVKEQGLWRNPGPDGNEWGRALVGGLPFMEVTDLQVRCQFRTDTTSAPLWTPTAVFDDHEGKFQQSGVSQFGTGVYIMSNLRLVEITLAYRTKLKSDYGTKWSVDKHRTISVSPRTVVMLNK